MNENPVLLSIRQNGEFELGKPLSVGAILDLLERARMTVLNLQITPQPADAPAKPDA